MHERSAGNRSDLRKRPIGMKPNGRKPIGIGRALVLVVVLASLAACGDSDSTDDGGLAASDLNGREFWSTSVVVDGEPVELTDKEYDLSVFLFRNIGRLLSRGHMLEAVWGRTANLATRTVDTHVSRVRSKLNLRPESGFRLVPTYNYGYRLEQLDDEAAP